MANPQKENGHIQISTELYEAFAKIRIPGEAEQVLKVVVRKTYGFNKKQDAIALSQFTAATGLSKTGVCKAIVKLKAMNIITQKGNAVANLYSINKDFDTWKPLPKKVTLPKKEITITQKGKKHYPKRDIQKTVTIDTITKDITPAWFSNPLVQEVYEYGINKGFSAYKQQSQAWAIGRLLKRMDQQQLQRAVDAAIESLGEKFAPSINNYLDLEQKLPSLIGFYKSKSKPQGRERKIWTSQPESSPT